MKLPLKDMSLDHIGIAVESIKDSLGFYEAMGLKEVHFEEVESEKVKIAMMTLSNGARLELLEPTSDESAVHKFLGKRGPGIHHICIKVDNIAAKLSELKEAGVRLIHESPKEGADNCLIAFIHPKATGGVLIELSQSM